MRKTKIICTMGPATENDDVLRSLIEEGMNVARFNFSHGSHEEQGNRMSRVKRMAAEQGKRVALLLDTKGPEIRTGDFKEGKVFLTAGQEFILTGEEIEGDETITSITYPELYRDVRKGTHILIDDGLIEMTVEAVKDKKIFCRVLNDGKVSNHKGINIPNVHVNMPYMSEKDRADILFGISQDVDYIAASFVRNAKDISLIRNLLDANGGSEIKIIAKVENREGVDNIDEIINEADAIMIARGDMGVELPEEEVPVIQKMIIKRVYEAGKQVITATQMLDSMMEKPRPTRAEAADVANAIYDGTSAIMLSGETASGKYPVESLKTMIRIANRIERDIDYKKRFFHFEREDNPDITDAICHATCTTAYDLNARAIVTVTKSGRSARMISRYRPECSIIGCTTSEKVCRQLELSWGVVPVLIEEKEDVLELFDHAVDASIKEGILSTGDLVVITSGVPIGMSGTTNMIKVQTCE